MDLGVEGIELGVAETLALLPRQGAMLLSYRKQATEDCPPSQQNAVYALPGIFISSLII